MKKVDFESIEQLFVENSNPLKIDQMEAYMKHRFKYLGITSPERKSLLKSIFKNMKWTREMVLDFVNYCWESKYRELHYAGLDILMKQISHLKLEDLAFLEKLVLKNSWWDTVDGLAVNCIGKILIKDEKTKNQMVHNWADSENIWLRRTAILHQLKYKKLVDVKLMELTLSKAKGTKEFFLNKAIGWMLREYAKSEPEYVRNYCNTHDISNLSRREALKHLL